MTDTPLWSDSVGATLEDGYYSVQLGTGSPLTPAHLAGQDEVWVGVAFDLSAELTPRTPLSRVPFAMEAAAISDGAGPLAVEGLTVGGVTVVDSTGHIDASRITGNTAGGVIPLLASAPSPGVSVGQLYLRDVPGQGGVDANTVLMLHSNAADGSTSFTDSSPTGRALSAVGAMQHRAQDPRFGSTAVDFRGGGSITAPDSADWDFPGDFTIDFWVKYQSMPYVFLIVHRNYGNTGGSWHAYTNAGTTRPVFTAYTAQGTAVISMSSSASFPLNAWSHIAIVRAGNTATMYLNGTPVAQDTTAAGVIAGDPDLLRLGDLPNYSGDSFDGFLDEVRITKGVARWTAQFVPPAAPYDSGATVQKLFLLDGAGAERQVLLAP